MLTKFILAAVAAATFSRVSASEPAIQVRDRPDPIYTTYGEGAGLPQKTAYAQSVYSQAAYPAYPNVPNYAAARKAAYEAAAAASYDPDLDSGSVSGNRMSSLRQASYDPDLDSGSVSGNRMSSLRQASYDSNLAAESVSGGRLSPLMTSYGRYKDPDAAAPIYAGSSGMAPSSAVMSARPNEELLGPFSGVSSTTESSLESSIMGKVTSLPASETSKYESSIRTGESSILGITSLYGTRASSTSSSSSADASRSANESDEGKATEETGKESSEENTGQEDEKKSGAGTLLWENGSVFAMALFALCVLLA